MTTRVLQPAGWTRPKGYANGMEAQGRHVYVSGQIGWDAECRFVEGGLGAQVRQTLLNIVAILAEAGAGPEHIVRLTWYVTSRDEYYAELPEIGRAYKEVIGRNFPTMAVVQVVALMEAQAKVEIEATAVVPLAAT
jgi:enamine deaminase RidA (YjgF/YER057c/UK114 family)